MRLSAVVGALFLAAGVARADDFYVRPDGDDARDGRSPERARRTIQKILDEAGPGDTIHLAPGIYRQDLRSVRHGEPGRPITIEGPPEAVIQGGGEDRVILIRHDYHTLRGFTVDGLHGSPDHPRGYRDILLYVHGSEPRRGVTGLRVLRMTFRNSGGEAVRLRYFARRNEIAFCRFERCGVYDFRFKGGGKNGEAVYIGTAPEQLKDGKNPTADPDACSENWIHHNFFDTRGNEAVDIKEASFANRVEYNEVTGQLDPDSGGLGCRGNRNVFRFNVVYGNAGAGIRLGGDGERDGIENDVYHNVLRDNRAGGLRVQRWPQGKICGNVVSGNAAGAAAGTYGREIDPARPCDDPREDTDGDGIRDADETARGLDPRNADEDADGELDGRQDWDRDGVPNAEDASPRG
ncbi:MAG TPA: right-handed parallel beta-helix repeat-containing protein [Planctomycetota bacterium]|nr:right-handed parallel beta-helix repeat-containing protein [Planctomycetota bacterium]